MEIIEDTQARAELIRQIQEREFGERTGIHMSDLNYCLNKQVLRRTNPVEDPAKAEQDCLLFSIGWSTQRWLTNRDSDEEPITVDGITVTLDAVWDDMPWELKASYQSSNRPIEENVAWMRQIMAQCHVKGCNEARLSRFALLGDWASVYPRGSTKAEREENRRASKRPTLSVYRFRFSDAELNNNWLWFLDRRTRFAEILDTGRLLPRALALPPEGSYECEYCYYNNRLCYEGDAHAR